MVQSCAVLATEQLAPKNMSRSAKGTVDAPGRRVRQKAGLNRELLTAGFGMAHPMLAYKAEEAGTRLHLSDTRQLKPSQRCSACWAIVPKLLSERMPVCPHCGHVMPRDRNSALVVLIDAIATQHTPGTGVAARPKPLPRQRGKSRSVTREPPRDNAMRLAVGEFIHNWCRRGSMNGAPVRPLLGAGRVRRRLTENRRTRNALGCTACAAGRRHAAVRHSPSRQLHKPGSPR